MTLEKIFSNGLFDVFADPTANMYRVVNVQTGILEDTASSQADALRYAIVHKNIITETLARGDESTAWPAVKREDIN